MFDIGFLELIVIAVLGLLVIGPDRLPGAVRSGAKMWGRLKYMLSETRTEIEKQIGADDIKRELHNEQVLKALEKSKRKAEAEFERLAGETEDLKNILKEHPDEWYQDEKDEDLYNEYHEKAHQEQALEKIAADTTEQASTDNNHPNKSKTDPS